MVLFQTGARGQSCIKSDKEKRKEEKTSKNESKNDQKRQAEARMLVVSCLLVAMPGLPLTLTWSSEELTRSVHGEAGPACRLFVLSSISGPWAQKCS